MSPADTFKSNSTSFEFSWPEDVSGLERVMLSARGDLQRLLSAFFSRPISIKTIYSHTSPRHHVASVETPISQKREVHLICNRKTVCIATSTVTITDPRIEELFLDEKFAIGQMFRKMGTQAEFALLECGTSVDAITGKDKIWRRYILAMEGFECDIIEVFPDREMFTREDWIVAESQVQTTVPVNVQTVGRQDFTMRRIPVV